MARPHSVMCSAFVHSRLSSTSSSSSSPPAHMAIAAKYDAAVRCSQTFDLHSNMVGARHNGAVQGDVSQQRTAPVARATSAQTVSPSLKRYCKRYCETPSSTSSASSSASSSAGAGGERGVLGLHARQLARQ
jgi:hypothetical protein